MTFFIDNQSLFARQLVESVSDIIYVLDLEKNDFQFLNSRAREMLDLSERSDLDVILHPDDLQKRKEHLAAMLKLADNVAREINVRLRAKARACDSLFTSRLQKALTGSTRSRSFCEARRMSVSACI